MNNKSFKPQLEALEERCCPTAYFWNPGAGIVNWDNPGNQGWHLVSDTGFQSAFSPTVGDTANFDNAKNCTLNNNPTVSALNFTNTATDTLSINGHTLTSSTFSFQGGTIAYGAAGGEVHLNGGIADSWANNAGFTASNNLAKLYLENGENLHITPAGTKSMQTQTFVGPTTGTYTYLTVDPGTATTTGYLDLGVNGAITTQAKGVLSFKNFGAYSVILDSTNANVLTNHGSISSQGYGPSAWTTLDMQVYNDATTSGIFAVNNIGGRLEVNDMHGHARSIHQVAGLTQVNPSAILSCLDGYYQEGGQFLLRANPDANDTCFTIGNYIFAGGSVYMNQENSPHNLTWDADTVSGSIDFQSSCALYLHVGKPANTDFIKSNTITLGGNLHVKNNGTFARNDTVSPIYASVTLSGSFANQYIDWVGVVALGGTFTSSQAGGFFTLTKT